jgi:hypothetical protein
MRRLLNRLAVLAAGAIPLYGLQAQAESNRVKFPEDLEQFVHYMTVKRGNVTEHISTTREAIDAVKKGQPIPNGTRFVLADYRDEKIHRYFVMEKGEGWGEHYDERRRSGDWQFQWYWPDKRINMQENTARCASCHQSQAKREHLFTASRISDFLGTPLE